jgi:FLYWCH zinc finger domain
MEEVLTQRNKELLLLDGHSYTKNSCSKSDPDLMFYVCQQRSSCKARIHVRDGELVKMVTPHSHLGDAAGIEAKTVLHAIKERAGQTQEVTSQIIQQEVANLSQAAAGSLPQVLSLKRTVQRKRRMGEKVPPNPATVKELQLPEEYRYIKIYQREEQFLYHDSGQGQEKRLLVFTTEANLDILQESEMWMSDGTFKVSPTIFYQLYTIHGAFKGKFFPLIFAVVEPLLHRSQLPQEDVLIHPSKLLQWDVLLLRCRRTTP